MSGLEISLRPFTHNLAAWRNVSMLRSFCIRLASNWPKNWLLLSRRSLYCCIQPHLSRPRLSLETPFSMPRRHRCANSCIVEKACLIRHVCSCGPICTSMRKYTKSPSTFHICISSLT
ncbi:hypothetical protein CSUB01_11568 [Colletotrichum sublineola]|uniref:Uncharacterized protein n=1 Tax=Colletotrichum sublineola TaxID=1173701 RepID=A0A066XGD6_COLSU|nr:hypothetical protein CSUB01_11568 [Colletotrichum sublineola]